MNPRLLALPLILLASLLVTSCETVDSSGYGYYLEELNDDTIVEFFKLSDDAANRQDYEFYESFFSPHFVSVDQTSSQYSPTYRDDYLSMVKEIFETAKSVQLQTLVRDIEYSESGYEALVKIHEEEKVLQFGNTRHYTSLLEAELEIEEGWIFINKITRTSMQVIEE